MNIVVISDTHGNYPAMIRAMEMIQEVDAIIHLGDFCDDLLPLEATLSRPFIRVPGNCDIGVRLPRELLLRFGDIPFLLCHGDAYGVKGGVGRLTDHARRIGAQVVLFGHTHTPLIQVSHGLLLVNPGTLEKESPSPTFALITIQDGAATARITPLPPIPLS